MTQTVGDLRGTCKRGPRRLDRGLQLDRVPNNGSAEAALEPPVVGVKAEPALVWLGAQRPIAANNSPFMPLGSIGLAEVIGSSNG